MNRKKKIVVIGLKGLPAFGGAARAGESVISLLSSKYDFTILSISSHTKLKTGYYKGFKQIVFKSIKSKKLNTFYYYLRCLFYVLFDEKFDLVQIHHIESGFIIPFLRLKYKVIGTARGKPYLVDKWSPFEKILFRFFEILFLKFSNRVIVVSKPHFDEYKKKVRKKIIYIPNGINSNEPFEKIKKKDYIFFAAGRIVEIKGLHTLIYALRILRIHEELLVAGDLNHNKKYKQKILSASQNLKIEYLGLIKEKRTLMGYLHECKLFIFPSFVEGMSNMLLEAASMKAPIICSDIPENRAVFNDNEVLFFRVGDSKELSEKIKFALNNYSKMKKLAENAHSKLLKEYNWNIIASKYNKIYEQELIMD